MTAQDELKDPWGWLVAAVSAGVGWAALAAPLGPLAIPVGVGIGAAVLGTKVALGTRSGDHEVSGSTKRPGQLPKPPRGSPQSALLAQAEAAQHRIRALADAPGDQWLSERIGRVDDEVSVVTDRLTELAGRVTVADSSLQSARPDLLAQQRGELAAAIAGEADPQLRAEREQTMRALDSQIQSVQRIDKLRATLYSRMQTTVLQLEGLAARMGELVALGDDAVSHDRSAEVLSELTGELDTMRSGLAEAEELSRRLP